MVQEDNNIHTNISKKDFKYSIKHWSNQTLTFTIWLALNQLKSHHSRQYIVRMSSKMVSIGIIQRT